MSSSLSLENPAGLVLNGNNFHEDLAGEQYGEFDEDLVGVMFAKSLVGDGFDESLLGVWFGEVVAGVAFGDSLVGEEFGVDLAKDFGEDIMVMGSGLTKAWKLEISCVKANVELGLIIVMGLRMVLVCLGVGMV